MSSEYDDKEIPASAIMYELSKINKTLEKLESAQQKILDELGGNGGPGIRTRIHSLEIGFEHTKNRMGVFETDIDREREFRHQLDNRITAIRNIGVGALVVLGLIEFLAFIIPLIQQAP